MRTLVTANGQLYQLSVNDKHVVIQLVTVRGGCVHERGRVEIPFNKTLLWDGEAWVAEALPRVGILFSRHWQAAEREAGNAESR
jgi:hypothetical protein